MIEFLNQPVPYYVALVTGLTAVVVTVLNLLVMYRMAVWRNKYYDAIRQPD